MNQDYDLGSTILTRLIIDNFSSDFVSQYRIWYGTYGAGFFVRIRKANNKKLNNMAKKVVISTSSDTAWKEVLDGFFQGFIEYCLPELNTQIDWNKKIISLDKELNAITKDSLTGTRLVDKLVQVHLKNGEEQLILIHIEVQGNPDKDFPKRMFTYGYRIYDRYQKPIVNCAILTDENEDWRPNHFEITMLGSKLSLDFLIIKLIDYKNLQAELEASSNPFASVILTQLIALETRKHPEVERLNIKYNLTRRLFAKKFEKDDIKKLFLFLDWLVHLSPPHELEYKEAVYRLEETKKMAYISSIERMGREAGLQEGLMRGVQQGIMEGEATLLIRQLIRKFGNLPASYQHQIKQADAETLLLWGEQVLEAKTLQEIFATIQTP